MAETRLGIIMHGVTGRMGTNQHLIRSICAIRDQGGVALADGTRVMPDPILRRPQRRQARAPGAGARHRALEHRPRGGAGEQGRHGCSSTPPRRRCGRGILKQAIAAGKHIYCEKPIATGLAEALDLYRAAKKAGIKHGVVQDKLWLPGLLKLKMLRDAGFFGRILSVRGEFGYWVFEGDWQAGAAAELELPQGRRRRHHPRHAVPLALCARQPVRRQ